MLSDWTLPTIVLLSGAGALAMCLLVLRYGFPGGAGGLAAPRRSELLAIRFGHALGGACFAVAAILAAVTLVEQRRARSDPDTPLAALRARLSGLEGRLGAMETRTPELSSRLGRIEARIGRLEGRVGDVEEAARRASAGAERAEMALRRLERGAAASRARLAEAPRPGVAAGRDTVPAPTAGPPPTAARRNAERSRPTGPDLTRAETWRADPAPPGPAPSAPDVGRPADAGEAAAGRGAPDLGRKLRDDWEIVKREGRAAREELARTFRRLRDWIAP